MIDMPLQNMSQPMGMVVICACKSNQRRALRVLRDLGGSPAAAAGQLPEPEIIRTFPVCSRAACTGLTGMVKGRVVHRPVGCGGRRRGTRGVVGVVDGWLPRSTPGKIHHVGRGPRSKANKSKLISFKVLQSRYA